jgi:hypothetical protein
MKFILFTILLLNFTQPVHSDDNQINPITVRIAQAKAENRKTVLVLGATPPERSNFTFPEYEQEPYIVYFNDRHERDDFCYPKALRAGDQNADWTGEFISGDFNHIQILEYMVNKYGSSFDLIIPDCSVSKFMDFTHEHLFYFLQLLSPNGRMVFDYMPSQFFTYNGANLIQTDEEALGLMFNLLNPKNNELVKKPLFRKNFRSELSEDSIELVNTTYEQYISGWKGLHLPNCRLDIVQNNEFPYWQATEREDRNGWISDKRDYLVLRRN